MPEMNLTRHLRDTSRRLQDIAAELESEKVTQERYDVAYRKATNIGKMFLHDIDYTYNQDQKEIKV